MRGAKDLNWTLKSRGGRRDRNIRLRSGEMSVGRGAWTALVGTLLLAALGCMGGDPIAAGAQESPGGPDAADTVPLPVLLVPGWDETDEAMAPLRARLIEEGWPPARAYAMSFRDPVGDNREHAREIEAQVRELRKVTGKDEIDVVAHSMGGLAVRYMLAQTGGVGVRRVVLLGTPNRGTLAAYVAWGAGGDEMEPGSPFLDSLNALPPVPPGIRVLTVRTGIDFHVLPGASATLPAAPNVRNAEVCCPGHDGLLDDDETFKLIQSFLWSVDGETTPPSRGLEGGRLRWWEKVGP